VFLIPSEILLIPSNVPETGFVKSPEIPFKVPVNPPRNPLAA
jgi:hypothetical protein